MNPRLSWAIAEVAAYRRIMSVYDVLVMVFLALGIICEALYITRR